MIRATPAAIPVAAPVAGLMDATSGLALVQAPPAVPSVRVVVLPTHTAALPEMPESGYMVTMVEELQLAGVVYVMAAVPGASPETMPDEMPIGAIPGSLLAQVPPVAASVRAIVYPWQTEVAPETGYTAFTVNEVVARQPAEVV